MNRPKITVIVPVYKAELYLEECIASIRQQTYRNLEIILVDDGSPDRCGAICDTFAALDPRIRVIHKENGGQSSARNAALAIASGEYIGFVDADDWIEPSMYTVLYSRLVEHDAQISVCGGQLDFPDGSTSYFNPHYPQDNRLQLFDTLAALENVIGNQQLTNSLCDKLYHRSILEGLRMSEGQIYEDMELVPQCLEKATKVVYHPAPYYHYRQTGSSTIRGEFTPGRFAEADVALKIARDYEKRYPTLYPRAFAYYISVSLTIIHRSRKAESCRQLRRDLIAALKKPLPKASVTLLRRITKLKLFALKLGTPAFELLMNAIDLVKGRK